jgi:hypothetical protein
MRLAHVPKNPMNKHSLSVAIGLLIAGSFQSEGQSYLKTGLVAHYRLNGDAQDSAGTNHGVAFGGASPFANRFAQITSAYNFDGASGRIEFNAGPAIQTTNFTLSAWVRPAFFSQAQQIAVYVGSDNGSSSDGFGFGLNGNSTFMGFIPAAGGFFSSGQTFPTQGQWYHVAMRRTNGITSLFVDGALTPNNSTAAITPPTDLTIGSQNGIRYFSGSVDDVRVFNRALSNNEIVQLAAYDESFTETNEPPPFCSPHTATATAVLFSGFLVGTTITDSGCGYTSAPPVSIQGGGGSNATATTTITNGRVTAINITSAGCCYTNPPQIVIGSPAFEPRLSIVFSRVAVVQHVNLGRKYVLESSTDLVDWTATGPSYTAQSETVVTEFPIITGRYFRIREVP